MEKTGPRVIGVGNPLVDLLTHVTDEDVARLAGEKGGSDLADLEVIDQILVELGEEVICHSGGSSANTVLAMGRLGLPCAYLGKLGRDAVGERFLKKCDEVGVDTSKFAFCNKAGTGRCLSMITPDHQRTMRTFLGAAQNLDPDEIKPEHFEGYDHAHLEAYTLFNPSLAKEVMKQVRAQVKTVSLGLASFEVIREHRLLLDQMLKRYVDVVIADEVEALEFAQVDDLMQALDLLAERCTVVAVTLGDRGSIIRRGEETVAVPPVTAHPIDATGAGDLWAAGFLYGYLSGWSLAEAGMLGSLMGAEVVQHHGSFIPRKDWEKIAEFIKERESRDALRAKGR